MSIFKQSLTEDQDQALWEAFHKARASSETVKVDKQALFNLMSDYGKMLNEMPEGYMTADGNRGP